MQASDLVGTALAPGLLGLARRQAPGVSLRVLAEEIAHGTDPRIPGESATYGPEVIDAV